MLTLIHAAAVHMFTNCFNSSISFQKKENKFELLQLATWQKLKWYSKNIDTFWVQAQNYKRRRKLSYFYIAPCQKYFEFLICKTYHILYLNIFSWFACLCYLNKYCSWQSKYAYSIVKLNSFIYCYKAIYDFMNWKPS